MDWVSYVVAGLMVYVAVAVFVLGMAYQVIQWLGAPRTRIKTGYFPKPRTAGERWLKVAEDSFVFPEVIKFDRWMWIFTILFHFGLLGAFVGHLRLLQEFTPLVDLLGSKGMDRFAFWSGGLMGIALIVGLLYYLFRRLNFPFRELSVPEDYILLVLLILTVVMGNLMRFSGDIHVAEYRAYLQSLLSFRPAFPEALAASATKWTLVLHVLFANLVFIFFPFSKLVHVIATFPANLARRR
jgi:respiratory nitrate reductase gamma subunit